MNKGMKKEEILKEIRGIYDDYTMEVEERLIKAEVAWSKLLKTEVEKAKKEERAKNCGVIEETINNLRSQGNPSSGLEWLLQRIKGK